MVERVLGIILPVFSVIVLGYFYARRVKPDMAWVNRINMDVLAPALIFTALANKDFDLAANDVLILGAIGVVAGSGLLAWPFARLLHEDPRTFVPPMMFNNCGNMGRSHSARPVCPRWSRCSQSRTSCTSRSGCTSSTAMRRSGPFSGTRW